MGAGGLHRQLHYSMKMFYHIGLLACLACSAFANNVVSPVVLDAGGGRSSSADYANDGSLGGFGGVVTVNDSSQTARTGYAGQLYEVSAFTLTAPSNSLSGSASMSLSALQFWDDGTVTPANSFAQWTFTNPIVSVNASGFVTAGIVGQNTPATVQARLDGWAASLSLMVIFTGSVPGYNQIRSQFLSAGTMRLAFVGNAGAAYALDRTFNLSPPVNWVPQLTNPADVNGILMFTNLANPTTNNFWRIRSVR